ncbi:MAG: PAS domain S-box protein [Dehalococcoidales bacterium]|nr:MAG: PAS domain S-box protein [Dehalococcoidales bacterium]
MVGAVEKNKPVPDVSIEEDIFQIVSLRSPAGMYVVQDGKFVFANPQFLNDEGYAQDEMLGSEPLAMVHPEDRERVRQNAVEMLKGMRTAPYEFRTISNTGEIRWLMETVAPIQYRGKRATLGNVLDITEQKQAEQELRESRHRFRDLVNLLPQGVYEIDENYIITFANQQSIEMLGYATEEVNANPLNALDTCIPEERERMEENIQRMLKGEKLGGIEYTLLRRDGTTLPVIIYSTSIIRDGKAVGLRGVIVDITERKQAEAIFQTISLSSPVSIFISQDGKFVFANHRFLDDTGFTEDELLNTGHYELVHPEDREMVRRNAVEMLKGVRTTPFEYRSFTKAGEVVWAAETIASIQYQGKSAVLGNVLDITEQKQAEQELKAQKDLIDHILATIPDAVLVVGKDNGVVLANAAFYDTFSMNMHEVEGSSISELIPGSGLSESLPRILLEQEPQIDLEFRYKSNGHNKTLVATIMKMGEEEALVILKDVTEERQKQERLFLTDRLSSIGEMSAGVAHELNNPLTGIVSLAQLLLEDNPPDELREDISDIHNEAQRAATIVRNLLAFSRKHAPVREATQINKLIEDVLRLRAYEHRVSNIEVQTQLAPYLTEVIVDYHQMQQVFLNIVLNAESAMAETRNPGLLTITTERFNGHVRISISDSGPGIPQENLNRLFDPFFTTKEVGKGTGLGLSICYGIVTQHGGKVYVQSEAGKGATFIVELPLEGQ